MKTRLYKYFGMIFALFAISCEAERVMPEQNNTFTLEQAKHFHMEHATDLRLPGTGDGSVKSAIDYNEILVPQWDKAIYHEVQFPSKLARTYEVPLNTGSIVGGVLLKENATEHDVVTMKSSLIIQEFSQGENTSNRQMVVTVLGKDSDNNAQSDAFSYMGSHKDFTGFMVVSTLEGEIVNIFQYLYGQRSVVYVRRTDDAPINAPLSGFSFLKVQGTKSSYGNSEPGFCHMCGKEGMVYIEYGHICESCLEGSELLDGIVVTDKPSYCDKCGELKGKCVCNPFACPICGYEPCQCDDPDGRCEYCREIGCNGECREDGERDGGDKGDSEDELTTYYSISVSIDGGGLVTGAGNYKKDTTIILYAVPNENFVFAGWRGDIISSSSSLTISNIDKDYELIANFRHKDSNCGKLAMAIKSYDDLVRYKNMIDTNAVSAIEYGYVRTSSGFYHIVGNPRSINLPIKENTLEVVHTHQDVIYPSIADLKKLYMRFRDNSINDFDAEDFRNIIVTPKYIMVMEIEDLDRIKELINNGIVTKIDGKTQFDTKLTEQYNKMLGVPFSSFEEAFVQFLSFASQNILGFRYSLHKVENGVIVSQYLNDVQSESDLFINNTCNN